MEKDKSKRFNIDNNQFELDNCHIKVDVSVNFFTIFRNLLSSLFVYMKKQWYVIFGTLGTTVSVFLIVLFFTKEYNNDDLFQKYYKSYEVINDRSDNISSALVNYSNGNYDESIRILSKVLIEENENLMARFYLGCSQIETNDFEKAIENFKVVVQKNNSIYTEIAEWYMALCLVKTYKTESAQDVLQSIIDKKGDFYKEAKNLLGSLLLQ